MTYFTVIRILSTVSKYKNLELATHRGYGVLRYASINLPSVQVRWASPIVIDTWEGALENMTLV